MLRTCRRSFHQTFSRNARKQAGSGRRDPLIAGRLRPVAPKDSISFVTETVRLNKAMVCMYEDKIRYEFPQLKQYVVPYQPRTESQILHFTQMGQVYPGSDSAPDPALRRLCVLEVDLEDAMASIQKDQKQGPDTFSEKDIKEIRRRLLLIAGDRYDQTSQSILITADSFLEYGQNKKYAIDCLERLMALAKDLSVQLEDLPEGDQGQKEKKAKTPVVLEFPEEWKRPELAGSK